MAQNNKPIFHNFWEVRQIVDHGKDMFHRTKYVIERRNATDFNKPLNMKTHETYLVNYGGNFWIPEADKWRKDAFKIMKKTPQHLYVIFCDDPSRIKQCLPKDWGDGYVNVVLGVSIQKQSDLKKSDALMDIPASFRAVRLDNLQEPIDACIPCSTGLPHAMFWDMAIINPLETIM